MVRQKVVTISKFFVKWKAGIFDVSSRRIAGWVNGLRNVSVTDLHLIVTECGFGTIPEGIEDTYQSYRVHNTFPSGLRTPGASMGTR